MKVFLTRTFFKPALIVLSILFGFAFLLFLGLTIAFYHVFLLILTLAIVVAYGVCVLLAFLFSKSEKYYLREIEGGLEIRYPKLNNNRGSIKMPYKALVGFEFFHIKSKNAWLNLAEYCIVPDCVYVTYINPRGRKVTELMGYITQADVEALAQRYNVNVTIN